MDLDLAINRFRLASRELFNHCFRVENPTADDSAAWELEERYQDVETVLFEKLVLEPAELSGPPYGQRNKDIVATLRSGDFAPIMLNREIDSGYWDHPVQEVNRDARLEFISFFDWDQLSYRDHRYVRVCVAAWPTRPEVVGKHAFIESQYVRFTQG